jgi:hypothetical protein
VPTSSELVSTKRRRLALSVAVIALLATASTIGVWAAWTATDTNPDNSFSTSTVLIDDNQGGQSGSATSVGSAIFNVSNLEPGSPPTTGCIGVDISGTAGVSSLTLSASLGGPGQAVLENQLTMVAAQYNTSGTVSVTPGANTNGGSCASYPAGGTNVAIGPQGATLAAWASGGPYTIANPRTNTWYRFTVSGLPSGDSSCVTYCGQTITMSLTWTLTTA